MRRGLSNCLFLLSFAAASGFAAQITTTGGYFFFETSEPGEQSVTQWWDGFKSMGVEGELTRVVVSGWGLTFIEFWAGTDYFDDRQTLVAASAMGSASVAGREIWARTASCGLSLGAYDFDYCNVWDGGNSTVVFDRSLGDFDVERVAVTLSVRSEGPGDIPEVSAWVDVGSETDLEITYVYTPVTMTPEPGTAWLFLGGLGATAVELVRRRRREPIRQ